MTKGEPVPFEPGNVNENIIIVGEAESDPLVDILSSDLPLVPGDDVSITKDALLKGV